MVKCWMARLLQRTDLNTHRAATGKPHHSNEPDSLKKLASTDALHLAPKAMQLATANAAWAAKDEQGCADSFHTSIQRTQEHPIQTQKYDKKNEGYHVHHLIRGQWSTKICGNTPFCSTAPNPVRDYDACNSHHRNVCCTRNGVTFL